MVGHLVLVGLMGSGKSTVGRECARRLDRPFVDTDEVVEQEAGRPVREIFAVEGEPGFRDRERRAVAAVCAAAVPTVIACGGGVVLDPANRAELRAAGVVVWLRAPVAELVARVGTGAGRPLLADEPVGALARLERERDSAYGAAAHVVVDTAGLGVDPVVDRVLVEYSRAGGEQ